MVAPDDHGAGGGVYGVGAVGPVFGFGGAGLAAPAVAAGEEGDCAVFFVVVGQHEVHVGVDAGLGQGVGARGRGSRRGCRCVLRRGL